MADMSYSRDYRLQWLLKKGDIVEGEGEKYIISGDPIGFGGSSVLYPASQEGCLLEFCVKECFPRRPEKYARINGIVRPENSDDEIAQVQLDMYRDMLDNERETGQKIRNTSTRAIGIWKTLKPVSVTTEGTVYTDVGAGIFSVLERMDKKGLFFNEFLAGISQNTPKEHFRKTRGLPNIYTTACIMEQALLALDRVHKVGYLFGDIQGANVFFSECEIENGTVGIGHLIDFGSARQLEKDGLTAPIADGTVFSTEGFCPPEICGNNGKPLRLGKQADVYSAGCLMLRCVVSPRKIDMYGDSPNVGSEALAEPDGRAIGCTARVRLMVNRILGRALSQAPRIRYKDAGEMLKDILHLKDCTAPKLLWDHGMTADTLTCAAERFYTECQNSNSPLFQTEYKPSLVDSLPIKRLEPMGILLRSYTKGPVHQWLEKYKDYPIFLQASGGAGKTFVLSEVFIKYLYNASAVPFYLDLANFDVVSSRIKDERIILYMIAEQYLKNSTPETIDKLDTLLKNVDTHLILDNCHKINPNKATVFSTAVKAVCKKLSRIIIAGRASGAKVLNNIHYEEVVLSPVREEQCFSAFSAVLGRPLEKAEKNIIISQYSIIGLPMFLMRTLEMVQLKKETIPDFHTAGQLLFEYFTCRLESQPAVSDMPADVSDMSTLINTAIPKLAFWCDTHKKYHYSAQELYEGTNLWDNHESMLNDLNLSNRLGIIGRYFDEDFTFSHDLYQGFFAALFVYRILDLVAKEQETYFLKKINCCWSNSTIQFIPDIAVCYQKPLFAFYDKMYSILEKDDQYSQILWNLTQSIGNREDLLRQQSQYKDLYIKFLSLSIRREVAPAYLTASRLYSDGKIIEPDIEKARYYLKKAADNGIPEAQLQLAEEYFQSTDKAAQKLGFEYCSRAADQNNPDAQFRLAEAWSRGEGVPWPDEGKAFELYEKAAKRGHSEAKYRCAHALYWGIGIPIDRSRSSMDLYLNSAAEDGVPEAQFMTSYYYIAPWWGEDDHRDWYSKAAKQGCAKAQFCLAFVIMKNRDYCNYKGFENTRNEAIELLQESAKNGIAVAAYLLHYIYGLGLWNVNKNLAKAVIWYQIANANEEAYDIQRRRKQASYLQYTRQNPHGQYLRGRFILENHKILYERHYKEAMGWFKLAADQGHIGARNYLDRFTAYVSKEPPRRKHGSKGQEHISIKEILDESTGLTVLELAELVHSLEEDMGLVPSSADSKRRDESILSRFPTTRQKNENSALSAEELLSLEDWFSRDLLSYDEDVASCELKVDSKDEAFYRDNDYFEPFEFEYNDDEEFFSYWGIFSPHPRLTFVDLTGEDETDESSGNYKESLIEVATTGNAFAMIMLADLYIKGDGCEQSYSMAKYWLEKAATADNADAMVKLANLYIDGKGCAQDYTTAKQWLEKACLHEHSTAVNNLAWMYLHGYGCDQNIAEAAALLEKAAFDAVSPNIRSNIHLGKLFLGVHPAIEGFTGTDPQRALLHLQKAKQLGSDEVDSLILKAQSML